MLTMKGKYGLKAMLHLATVPEGSRALSEEIATAMDLTAAGLFDQNPVRGNYVLDATLVTKENAQEFYYPDSPF